MVCLFRASCRSSFVLSTHVREPSIVCRTGHCQHIVRRGFFLDESGSDWTDLGSRFPWIFSLEQEKWGHSNSLIRWIRSLENDWTIPFLGSVPFLFKFTWLGTIGIIDREGLCDMWVLYLFRAACIAMNKSSGPSTSHYIVIVMDRVIDHLDVF